MRPEDDAAILEIATLLVDASLSLSETANNLTASRYDAVGVKARIEQTRIVLEKAHELLDGSDGLALTLLERLKRCWHPQEAHILHKDAFWLCRACGEVYTGLKWASHSDEPKSKD